MNKIHLMEPPFELNMVGVRLVKESTLLCNAEISTPLMAVAAFREYLQEMDREVLLVVNLNNKGFPINASVVSIGAISKAVAEPRELIKSSILSNAAYILLFHCHPSGNPTPSKEDIQITDRLNHVCELIGIPLVDHVIVGCGGTGEVFSFKEKGMLDLPRIKYETRYDNLSFRSLSCVAE